MKFTVEFTRDARQDLLEIYDKIKIDGRPQIAKKPVQDLTEMCLSLEQNPERGSVPRELSSFCGILCRQLIFKKFRIFYYIIGKVVIVARVIYGRRDMETALQKRGLF